MYRGAKERKRTATKKVDRRKDISAASPESVKFEADGSGKLTREKINLEGGASLAEVDTIAPHIGREIVKEAGGSGDCEYRSSADPVRCAAKDYILLSSSDPRCIRQIRFGLSKRPRLKSAEIGSDIVREGSVTGQIVIPGSGLVSFQVEGATDLISNLLAWIRNKADCFTGQGTALFTIETTEERTARGSDSATDPIGKMQARMDDRQTSDDAARIQVARESDRSKTTTRSLAKRDDMNDLQLSLARLNR